MAIKSVCVFCGSGLGNDAVYVAAARQLGKLMAEQGMGLVYGGAKIGLMGAIADTVLEAGGTVIGVIPHFLRTKEVKHEGLTELILVETMHERKLKMHELSDAVITLPGGWGTLEEMFEMLTWGQLGLHSKPMGLLNTKGYYNCLGQLMDGMQDEGFLKPGLKDMLLVHEDPAALLEAVKAYRPTERPQWITKQTT